MLIVDLSKIRLLTRSYHAEYDNPVWVIGYKDDKVRARSHVDWYVPIYTYPRFIGHTVLTDGTSISLLFSEDGEVTLCDKYRGVVVGKANVSNEISSRLEGLGIKTWSLGKGKTLGNSSSSQLCGYPS